MEDQIKELKSEIYDTAKELQKAKQIVDNTTNAFQELVKLLAEKLEITEEEIKDFKDMESFAKELDRLVLVKEEEDLE